MTGTLYKCIRRWLGQTAIAQRYRMIRAYRTLPKYTVNSTKLTAARHKSIVFLCPANNMPIGGNKVIYRQAAIINNEMKGQIKASVLHPFNPRFSCTWFDHGASLKTDLAFDRKRHFVIIPEFWAVPHARLLQNIGVRYGIYVQGGYVMGIRGSDFGEEHDAAYHNASLIMAISDDTAESIKLAFPECTNKVQRIHYSVNHKKFKASSNKENIICYMPRRLENHSKLVTFFLGKKLPPNWRIESIDGLDEDGVAAILGKSRIFLSFSELEGCPLPPLEAALSGCYVIGYTGEGAKEYWDTEIFTEIYSGDIKSFVKAILNKIAEIESTPFVAHTSSVQKLANKYSTQVELADMQFVSKKVIEILKVVDNH